MNATQASVKPLNPRSPDTKYTGLEPTWRVQPTDDRTSQLSRAFSWYNYFYGKKDARDMIVNYLEQHDRKTDVKLLKGIPDSSIRLTTGWLCRMSITGLELTDCEQLQLDNLLKEILESNQEEEVLEKVEDLVPRITIQDRLREKLNEASSELDGMFDDMIVNGAKMSADYKPIVLLRGLNVAPQLVSELVVNWKKQLEELEELQKGKDAQLVEGYSNFNKVQVRNLIKFVEQVISDCASYVQIKKVERKPRKVKPVSPEKVAAKFKYCKEFAELKLKSEPVTKLVGAQEAWLYDTKKRKLIYVIADSHIGSFTVKGSGLIGFDTVLSVQKTLRKPADQIKALLTGGVAQHRKYFKDIKSTDVQFNGRGNENLVLLKVR